MKMAEQDQQIRLQDFCYDIQENIVKYLPTKDIITMSKVCWFQSLESELEKRRLNDKGFTFITRSDILRKIFPESLLLQKSAVHNL